MFFFIELGGVQKNYPHCRCTHIDGEEDAPETKKTRRPVSRSKLRHPECGLIAVTVEGGSLICGECEVNMEEC